jgi:hypothetical protein
LVRGIASINLKLRRHQRWTRLPVAQILVQEIELGMPPPVAIITVLPHHWQINLSTSAATFLPR